MMIRTLIYLVIATLIPYSWTLATDQQTYSKCTDVIKEHISYNWTLRNVNLMVNGDENKIRSPPFFTRNTTDKWEIHFYPKGWKTDNNDWASIYLQLMSSQKLGLNAQWEMTVFKSDEILHTYNYAYTYSILEGYGRQLFIRTSEFRRGEKDEITIRCELDIPLKVATVPCKESKISEKLAADLQKHTLIDDFRLLFESMDSSDVSLIVENHKFSAHKSVLSARSPIFAAMLRQLENENNSTNTLTINDMTPTEVRGMLEFIYTDNVTDLSELTHGLLAAADTYQLHRLKAMCEEVLYREFNTLRAADTLMFAHLYHSDELKKYSLDFITEHFTEVSQTQGYKKMTEMYPVLISELLQSIIPKISEHQAN